MVWLVVQVWDAAAEDKSSDDLAMDKRMKIEELLKKKEAEEDAAKQAPKDDDK